MKNKMIDNEINKDNWNKWSDELYAKRYKNEDTLKILKDEPMRAF